MHYTNLMENELLLKNFDSLCEKISRESWPVHGIQLYSDGILLKSFGKINFRYPVYSITKSILSMAAGIAEKEGLINLQDCILKYIPESYLERLEHGQTELFKSISIERLLTMSVKGFAFRPEGENWLINSLNTRIDPDRKEFHYTNICAYLVGAALSFAVNRPANEYIDEKIFGPLEISDVQYGFSPEGIINGGSGIELSVEELAKVGLMLMNKGVYKDRQIVPEEYLKRAVEVQIKNKEGGYGYFFWKYLDGFSLNGKWGQKCYCMPKDKTLICFLSNFEGNSDVLKNEIRQLFY